MAFNPTKDYTAAIAKTTDPALKAQLEREKAEKIASMSNSGYDYTKPTDVSAYNKTVSQPAPTPAPVRQSQESQQSSVPQPTAGMTNEQYALMIGQKAREAEASGVPQSTEPLVTYYDEFGRPQTIFQSYEGTGQIPSKWTKIPPNTAAQTPVGQAPVGQAPVAPTGIAPAATDSSNVARLIAEMKRIQDEEIARQQKFSTDSQSSLMSTLNSGKSSTEQLMAQLSEAQKKSLIASLSATKTAGLGSLSAEQSKLPQDIEAQKSAVRSATALKAKELSDRLAAMGLARSGAAERVQGQLGVQEISALGNLSKTQAEKMADIEARKTGLETNYQTGVSTGTASIEQEIASKRIGLEQDYSNKLFELKNQNFKTQAEFDAAQSQLNRDTLLKVEQLRQYEQEKATQLKAEEAKRNEELKAQQSKAELEQFVNTASQYSQDYTAQINKMIASGVPENDYKLDILRSLKAEKIAKLNAQKADLAVATEKEKQQIYENTMDLWKELGVANQKVSSILGIPVGTKTESSKFKEIELQIAKTRAANSGSSSSAKTTLTYDQALRQARLILGDSASAQDVVILAKSLQNTSIDPSVLPDNSNVQPPSKVTGTTILNYLQKLESARDLVAINTFMTDSQNIRNLESELRDPNTTETNRKAIQSVFERYNKYK